MREIDENNLDVWMRYDISAVSESEFPIHCINCGHLLAGLGSEGRCPECGESFERRLRLWELWGEAPFKEARTGRQSKVSVLGLFLHSAVVTGSFIAVFVAWGAVFGRIEVCTVFVVWLIVLAGLEAIILPKSSASGDRNQTRQREGKVD